MVCAKKNSNFNAQLYSYSRQIITVNEQFYIQQTKNTQTMFEPQTK